MFAIIRFLKRILLSVIFAPLFLLRYLFTGVVITAPDDLPDIENLLNRINGLRHQNKSLTDDLDQSIMVMERCKEEISLAVEGSSNLDQHEKSFCMDVASAISHVFTKDDDGIAKDRLMAIISPGLAAIKQKTKLKNSDQNTLDKAIDGDKESIVLFFVSLLSRK